MQAQLEPLGGALQLTELRSVLDAVVEQAVTGLRDLAAQLPSKADDERKRALLQYLHATRQRLLRLHVLAQWGNMAPAAAAVSRVLDAASRQVAAARDAADQLAMAHAHIAAVQAPIHDVPTAVEVLETGGYRCLPAAIEELRPAAAPAPAERAAALRLMDQMLRARLLQEALPAGLQVSRVRSGVATLAIPQLLQAKLTLVPAPDEEAVLARCGASSGVAPSPAPSGVSAPADGAQPAAQAAAAIKAEPAAEPEAEPAAGCPAPQQAADAPASEGPCADAGADAPPEPSSQPPEQRHEHCRWRLLSFTILPAFKERPAVAAHSAAALQGQLEARMWAAADAAVLAAAGAVRAASGAQPSASAQPSGSQQLRSSPQAGAPPVAEVKQKPGTPARSTGTPPPGTLQSGGRSAPGSGSSGELPTPLGLMTTVLKGVATRILMQEAVASLRKLAAAEGPWRGSLRISEPRILKMGARAAYWTSSQPVVNAAQLATDAAGQSAAMAVPTAPPGVAATTTAAQPGAGIAIELGIDAAGDIRIVADPPLQHPATPLPVGAAGDEPSQTAQPQRTAQPPASSALRPSDAAAAGGTAPATLPAPDVTALSSSSQLEAGSGGAISPAGTVAEGLWIDPATGNAAAPLLAAARATAALQLASLQQALQTVGSLAAAGGVAVLCTGSVCAADAADDQQDGSAAAAAAEDCGPQQQPQQQQLGASPSGSLATGGDDGFGGTCDSSNTEAVLELQAGGAVVLAVSVAAASGRLTLRLGPGAADESALDQGAFTKQEEDTLARHQREAAARAAASHDAAGAPAPALAAIAAAGRRLAVLFGVLAMRRRLRGLVAAARAHGLRESTLPRHLLQAYSDGCQGAVLPPQRFAVLAWAPTPPLAGFPAPSSLQPLQQPSPKAAAQTGLPQPPGSAAGSSSGWSLRFCLLAAPAAQRKSDPAAALPAPAAADAWDFWLTAVRATPHGVPQQVLQLSRVPPQQLAPAASLPAAPTPAPAAALQPDRAPSFPGKHKRRKDADSVHTGADPDARPAKLPREASNGLRSAAPSANGPTGRPAAAGGEATANGTAAPALQPALANGRITGAAAADSAASSGVPSATDEQPDGSVTPAGDPVSAGLAQAVDWCRSRLTWAALLLQLQALGTPFSEQLTLGPSGGACLSTSTAVASTAAASAAPKQTVQSLRLRGFGALTALDAAAQQPAAQQLRHQDGGVSSAPAAAAGSAEGGRSGGAAASEPTPAAVAAERPGLALLPGSLAAAGDGAGSAIGDRTGSSSVNGDSGAFRAVLCSSYLAGLPIGRIDSSDGGSSGSTAISRVEGGLSIAYSLGGGDTVLTAAMDALRIARLHAFVQRLRLLSAASQAAPVADAAAATVTHTAAARSEPGSDEGRSFLLPGCGEVQLIQASPLRAVLVARPSAAAGSATAADAAAAGVSGAAVAAGIDHAGPIQRAQELHVTIEWLRAEQAAPGQPAGQHADGDAIAAGAMRCSVSAVAAPSPAATMDAAQSAVPGGAAPVPNAWCAGLAEMAEAGEEALLLRGLAVAGPCLAAAMAAVGPDALATAGWLRGQVMVQAARPPYSVQLLLQKSPRSACRLDLRFAAGQLTWVSARPAVVTANAAAASTAAALQPQKQEGVPQPPQLDLGAMPPSAPASQLVPASDTAAAGDLDLPQLFAQLAAQHAAVSLHAAPPAAAAPDSEPPAAAAPPGIWVHGGGALQSVIAAVLAHLSQRLL